MSMAGLHRARRTGKVPIGSYFYHQHQEILAEVGFDHPFQHLFFIQTALPNILSRTRIFHRGAPVRCASRSHSFSGEDR